MMIGNQGGHLRKPIQTSRTGLSIQELKAMTALRMSQGPEVVMTTLASGSDVKSLQQVPASSYANSRSRRQASRAAATMYLGDFGPQAPQQLQPPPMTRVTPSPPPTSASTMRIDKQQAHSLTVQELKELTRMRLAREAVGPISNNTSTSTETDLDAELHHIHGVNRKNSANSLLTTTTLESRESDGCSHSQSRSGTISPVSDSFIDDTDLLFNNYGAQPPHLTPSAGPGVMVRRHPNIVTPGYPPSHHASQPRTVNFHPNPTRGLSPGPGHSTSQTMHAQATAQMALLMDNQRREIRDSRLVEDVSATYEGGGLNPEQGASTGYGRVQQRFEDSRQAEMLRRQRTQEQEFSQKCMNLARLQQQAARERCRSAAFPFEGLSQEEFHASLPTTYERGEFDIPTLTVDTQLGARERDSFQGPFEEGYRGPTPVPAPLGDIQSDLRFTERGGEPYMPPPVLGMMRKQQAMVMNMAYHRDMNIGNMFSLEIPPPPPSMSPLILRNPSTDSIGCSSPSMRHKSALSIACPGPVRERTLSDVNSLAFQMAEACLDSNSNPSTPKFSHRTFSSSLSGGLSAMNGGQTDYLAQALRRMNSTDSVSSVGSNSVALSNLGSGLSLSGPRGYGQVYAPENFGAETLSGSLPGTLGCPVLGPATEAWAL